MHEFQDGGMTCTCVPSFCRFNFKFLSQTRHVLKRNIASSSYLTNQRMAKTVGENYNFPKEEEKILELWKKIDAFKTSLKLSEGKPR